MCICNTSAPPIRILSSCSPDRQSMSMSPAYSLSEEDENDFKIQEDETCFMLSIQMPNVSDSDLKISLRENVLSISGFRRSRFSSECSYDEQRTHRVSTKRQRISRQLVIDPNAIDIERAMASTYNGCYTLYAPKRRVYWRIYALDTARFSFDTAFWNNHWFLLKNSTTRNYTKFSQPSQFTTFQSAPPVAISSKMGDNLFYHRLGFFGNLEHCGSSQLQGILLFPSHFETYTIIFQLIFIKSIILATIHSFHSLTCRSPLLLSAMERIRFDFPF